MQASCKPRKPHTKRRWLIPLCLLAALMLACAAYVYVYYHADETALLAMNSSDTVTVLKTNYGYLFDGPSDTTALIFYPGAKVQETAYAPLLHALAASGVDVCLVKMPLRLAFLNGNAAVQVMQAHAYKDYYIGGHSLGGAMAASYAAGHGQDLSGVILLAAYATSPLPDSMTEIVLAGSQDQVLNWDRLAQGRDYAPTHYVEHIIEGGNHAQFGSYGPQRGDGAATISPQEQIAQTVQVILDSIQ